MIKQIVRYEGVEKQDRGKSAGQGTKNRENAMEGWQYYDGLGVT